MEVGLSYTTPSQGRRFQSTNENQNQGRSLRRVKPLEPVQISGKYWNIQISKYPKLISLDPGSTGQWRIRYKMCNQWERVKGEKVRKEKRGEEEMNIHHRPSILQFLPFEFLWTPIWPFYSHFHSFFFISFSCFWPFNSLAHPKGVSLINRIPPLFNFFVSVFPCQLSPRGFCPRALLCDELVPSTLMEIHLTSALLLSTS